MSEVVITKENFNAEVINSQIPVLVDFWATWCGPCRMLGPVLAQIGEEQAGKVKIAKINVDEQPELADQFRVDSIPLVLVFKNGQVVNKSVGYRPKEQIEALLK